MFQQSLQSVTFTESYCSDNGIASVLICRADGIASVLICRADGIASVLICRADSDVFKNLIVCTMN
jgi:hypothetical protein